ncbi:MAG: hypothetical protein ACJA2S_002923, partial [Cyclobacteriaceae bacterium]
KNRNYLAYNYNIINTESDNTGFIAILDTQRVFRTNS